MKKKLWNKDFVLLLQGNAVSTIGDLMYSVAIGYWVYEQTGSSGLMGIMSAISTFEKYSFGVHVTVGIVEPTKDPTTKPITVPVIFQNFDQSQFPFGSYPIIGLLLQYTYKLQPIGFDVSKYSTSSLDIHLYISGL